MMLLKIIAEYAESINAGTIGRDLFAYNMPETSNLGVLLRQPLTGAEIDYELPGYRKAKFQVIVRCKPVEIEQGLVKITEFVDMITVLSEMNLSGMQIKYMRPRHDPVLYPVSEGNNLEYSVNFDVVYVIVR